MECSFKIPFLLALVAILPACGKSEGVKDIALAVGTSPNCLSGQDRLWSELYRQVSETGALPSTSDVEGQIRSLSRTRAQATALVEAYSSIAREVRFLGRDEALVRLAQMEIGDRTDEVKMERQNEVETKLSKALAVSVAALGECPNPAPGFLPKIPDSVSLFESWRTTRAAPLYGAYKTISVGYQSCNILGVAPLSASTPLLEGVVVTGTHPNGVGLKREVRDPDAVFRTNPFYANRLSPVSGCFHSNVDPLIYDYGGKPFASGASIDLFENGGTGTGALGIDCSGFVTTSILVAGLRLKENTTSKAPQASGVNAAMFANPAGNGLSCFERVRSTASESLREGDILANGGHVIMIDRLGADPLGIASAKTREDCDGASAKRFSFTIIQSSSSKGGMGMNRYSAKDFLATSPSMTAGLEGYARSFCRVRLGFDQPSTLANASQGVLVRHVDSEACQDAQLNLSEQGCLSSCGSLASAR